jgi:serine phosphatase RsbU (regulator of sigma subunit)
MMTRSLNAIDSALLSQELSDREAELAIINSVQQALASHLEDQAIYNLVGDKIRDIFDSQVVMISTYDPQTETIEHRYAIERGEHIIAPGRYPNRGFRIQIVQTRQPVLVNKNVAELAAKLGQYTIPGTVTPKAWLGVPMMVGDQVTGILSLQNLDREDAFDDGDVRLLQTLAASMSVALENVRLFNETQRLLKESEQRASELQIINSLQEDLVQKLEEPSIYNLVGAKLHEYFRPLGLNILVYDSQTDFLSSVFLVENGEQKHIQPYSVGGKGFFGQLLQHPHPLLINEHMEEAALQYEQAYSSDKGLPKSALYAPLMIGGSLQGAIVLQDMAKEQAFGETDVRLLKTLANAVSAAVENARLWEQEALYRKALEREFEIGREIQAGFIPHSLPQPVGWEIAALLKSAREVTGDFYDVFELAEGQIGLVIADVCDKGLGAALFMTLFRSLVRAVSNIDFFANDHNAGVISPGLRIKNAISLTNNYIAETHSDTSMFATIFFGILDTSTAKLTYVNGGHLPPMIINKGGVKQILDLSGPAVGAAFGAEYSIHEVDLDHGDVFFAHTDGLTDSANRDGEFLSVMKCVPFLTKDEALSIRLEQILRQINEYSDGAEQIDDITLLVVRRTD